MSKEKIYCNPGNPLVPEFEIGVDDAGVQCLVPVIVNGKQKYHNLQDEIQSYADECDIKTIVAKAINGDLSGLTAMTMLNQSDAPLDTTYLNKSINELHQINLETESTLRASYAQFAAADKISFNDYCEALKSGNIDKLAALVNAPAGGDGNANNGNE